MKNRIETEKTEMPRNRNQGNENIDGNQNAGRMKILLQALNNQWVDLLYMQECRMKNTLKH